MKKTIVLLAVLVLVLGLCACGGVAPETSIPESTAATTEPIVMPTTVPADDPAVVGGVDLSKLTAQEAAEALNVVAASYQLELTVNDKKMSVSAADIGLKLDEEALQQYLQILSGGQAGELPEALFVHDRELLKALISESMDTPAGNASVVYNSPGNRFEVKDSKKGSQIDTDAAADAAAASVGMLMPAAGAEVKTTEVEPEITRSSEKVTKALDQANSYLKVSLTYTYGESNKESIGASTLAGFVKVSDDLIVSISKSAIEQYAGDMASKYAGGDYKGRFVTTGGTSLDYTVTYTGQRVDKSALADDIYKCVTEKKSGTRTAPYSSKSAKPFGGNYVEINLSSQKLWLYKDGEQIVSTKLVSGCVAEGHRTPTGIYSIYAKQTNRYLTGEDYRSFVSYWMPFHGGYGLHDASWRSSFGGSIYHYNGSHGCINLPSSAAKKIYNNISVGTKVILYGGKTEVPDMVQKLTGTTSYTVKSDAKAFDLNIKAKYKDAKLTYTSSNTDVVTVSSGGTVTVKGPGTAKITVKAAAYGNYTGAKLEITVTVEGSAVTKPTESKPTESKPTEPKPTEPKPTEPKPTEPKPTEPKPTESKPTEPKPTEPKPTEPKPTEPKPTEPKPTEPKPTEPKPTEPKPTEPKPTEPKPTEPEPTEPKPTEPEPTEAEATVPEAAVPVPAEPTEEPAE